MDVKQVAILGATSHIAKGLIIGLSQHGYKLTLFARSLDQVHDFVKNNKLHDTITILPFEHFGSSVYDVIINCVGIGDPQKLKYSGSKIFYITEQFDNLILDFLVRYPDTLYINLSSGASYGINFKEPVDESSYAQLNINNISTDDYYGIAKLYIEAKHRSLNEYNIVDLRVFGYFSRFINLSSSYFISEIILCIKQNRELVTRPGNIVRDYVDPSDLVGLIESCIDKHKVNDTYDVYSLAPVTKFEILEFFTAVYKLKYVIDDKVIIQTATGLKEHYYSKSRKAEAIGYTPTLTSLECIKKETEQILHNNIK